MLVRFGRGLVVVALCCSLGGQWFGLQSIAWATMLVKYSQNCPIKQAIAQTFDGDHPCDMCKHISKSREKERKPEAQTNLAKADLICVTGRFWLLPPFKVFRYSNLCLSSEHLSRRPLLPPPRGEFI